MRGNFSEVELRRVLRADIESHLIKELGDSSLLFELLAKAFPISGARIDWARVPDSIERMEEDEAVQREQFIKFFDEAMQRFRFW
jgi:hypothetical protein